MTDEQRQHAPGAGASGHALERQVREDVGIAVDLEEGVEVGGFGRPQEQSRGLTVRHRNRRGRSNGGATCGIEHARPNARRSETPG